MTFGLEGLATGEQRNAALEAVMMRFGVIAATPTPTPTQTVIPDPEGTVRLRRGTVRVTRQRRAAVRLKCVGFEARRCRGRAKLLLDGERIAGKRFSARVDRLATRRLRLERSAYRRLRREGRLRVTFEVTIDGADPVSVSLTLKPRRHR